MRIGIIGAGAIGCVVGGLLAKAGEDVTLVDQWPEHVETMRAKGLRLSGTCGDHVVPVRALHIHELQGLVDPFDTVFIAVKSYDTEWATAMGVAYLKPDGVVVDFQNGINDHRVAAVAGRERTLGCVILISAGMYEPGHAMRTDAGKSAFKIGEHDGRITARAQRLAQMLCAIAPAEATANLWGERWSKLALNCMVNPVSALSGYGTAEVRLDPAMRRLSVFLGAEAIAVGRAAGFEVEPIWGIATQRFVDAAAGKGLAEVEAAVSADAASRRGGRPSMLQDVMRGRRTEVEHLNGYVAAEGKRLGVPAPLNAAVVEVFRAQGATVKPDPGLLEPLYRLIPGGVPRA
jgi:2-dehydropantoate 2-reductase